MDPRVFMYAALLASLLWVGGKVAHGVKVVSVKVGCGVAKVVGHPCKPKPQVWE